MTTDALRTWLAEHGVSSADLAHIELDRKRALAYDRYMQIVANLGFHPTTTVLQREQRNLAAAIARYWGSHAAFRAAFGVPTPPPGNPFFREDVAPWLALVKRRAFERRTAILADIIALIADAGPQRFNQILHALHLNDATLRKVLTTALTAGALHVVAGPRPNTRYYAIPPSPPASSSRAIQSDVSHRFPQGAAS